MSDTEGEAAQTAVVLTELTEDQKAFLKECDTKYANRFTKDDEEFMELYNKEFSTPPIMPLWRANRGRRDSRRGGRRDYRGEDRRGDRGGDRGDDRSYGRDNRDNRQSGDNYHSRGYKRSYDDRDGEWFSYGGGGNNYRQDNNSYRDNRQ